MDSDHRLNLGTVCQLLGKPLETIHFAANAKTCDLRFPNRL